ncbi:hypothetical protein ACKKBG_A21835 [Auxenochlorella protothecoides x Auxenochlorella symbiontica]
MPGAVTMHAILPSAATRPVALTRGAPFRARPPHDASQKALARRLHTMRNERAGKVVCAAAADDSPDGNPAPKALAPSPPTTSLGEMASYYLSVQPHLFQETVDRQFSLLQEAKEKDQASESGEGTSSTSTDLVLSRRMAEVQRAERGRAVEDLMYVCILGKFRDLGVDMLPRIEEVQESSDTLRALTEGVHSREALDMVKEHVLGVLGPASMAYAATKIKMSALQAAQVYAASVLFGYFLRRVDTRFQLAKSLDMLPESQEEAVARLERLFSAADDGLPEGATPHPEVPGSDAAAAKPAEESEAASSDRPPADQPPPTSALVKKTKGALRRYVESFDQQTMLDMAKLVTQEGGALVERQTKALFGDPKALQRQMQEAVGKDIASLDDLMERVQKAVADGKVETLTLTVGTQRRAVLEAVAYGVFLRDVESWVDGEYALLSPHRGGGSAGLSL